MTIRVSLHAPDAITATGIAALLVGTPGVTVLDAANAGRAEVLVVADNPPGSGAADRRQPIVLIADDVTDVDVAALTSRHPGAAVVARRRASTEMLVKSIVTVAGGGFLIGEGAGEQVLSRRELAVLRLVADGYDTAEIALKVGRSARTVKQILRDVTKRSRLRNRTHAVAFAIRAGLL